ncbi:MAG: sugar nucleotide-binding protein, partial [Pirellulales bacterium]
DRYNPWAVNNAAGYVRVDDAEREPGPCFRENERGAAALAAACAGAGIPLVTFSSDLVFDGQQGSPYREQDTVGPLGVYGRTKAEAERRVLALHPRALVIRTSAFFGPWDEYNFVTAGLRTLRAGLPFPAADDTTVSPTYVPDLVHACLDLLIDAESGVWHLANQGETTWAGFARRAAALAELDPKGVQGLPSAALGLAAQRPKYAPLISERGFLLPPLEDALGRYFRDGPLSAPAPTPDPAEQSVLACAH